MNRSDMTGTPWLKHMRSLLGHWVETTVDWEQPVQFRGFLHAFSDDGDVCLRASDGHFRWVWPNLKTREIPYPYPPWARS